MLPAAPTRFSTITLWFQVCARRSPITRASASGAPPAAKPTRMRIGFDGQVSSASAALRPRTDENAMANSRARIVTRGLLAGFERVMLRGDRREREPQTPLSPLPLAGEGGERVARAGRGRYCTDLKKKEEPS